MPHWSATHLEPWLNALKNGEIAAAPAEGMYGYVADPFNPQALQKVYEAKQRNASKGFIVLISSLKQLEKLTPHPLEEPFKSAIRTKWPYPPVTLVLPALPSLPPQLTGGLTTLAIRYPHKDYMLEYLDAFGGPLVSTSLNISGQPPATRADQIPASLPALTLPKPLSGKPSRIYNPATDTWLR